MKNLNKIISSKEVSKLVEEGKGRYLNWGQKRYEIFCTEDNEIYWHHTSSHYHYIGEYKDFKFKDVKK